MFKDWLNTSFIGTRTSSVTDPITHIVKQETQTVGPYACRTGRANGNVIQSSPQTVFTQSLRLYTLIDADVKVGDVIAADNIKYTVSNVYKPAMHHIEADIIFKQEV